MNTERGYSVQKTFAEQAVKSHRTALYLEEEATLGRRQLKHKHIRLGFHVTQRIARNVRKKVRKKYVTK